MPGRRSATSSGARVVGGAQLVAPGGGGDQLAERALVDDAAGAHDRDAVAQLLDLGHQVRGEQHGDPLVGEPADERAHVAHARRDRARSSARRAAAAAGRAAARPRSRAAGACRASSRRPCPSRGPRGRRCRARRRCARRRRRRRAPRPARGSCARSGTGRSAAPRRSPATPSSARAPSTRGSRPNSCARALVGPDQPEQHPQRRRLPGAVGPEVAVDVAGARR